MKATKNGFELNLLDLPHERLYVVISEKYKKHILACIKEQMGSKPRIWKKLGISQYSFCNWKLRNEFPLIVLVELLNLLNLDTKEIQKNTIKIRSGFYPPRGKIGGSLGERAGPEFPIKMSKELARIIAHLFGDGCLSTEKIGYVHMQYYNQNMLLREQFKNDIRKLFNNTDIYESVNKSTPFVSISSSIAIVFKQIIDDYSSKTSSAPDIIKNASREFKIEFIKSFYDDEAHVRFKPPQRYIELTLSNKKFLMDVKNLLKELGIDTSRTYVSKTHGFMKYTTYIRNHHTLKKYYQNIGFNHENKQETLQKIIKNPGRKHYSHGETERLVLDLLKKEALTEKEISKALERKRVTINLVLNDMKNRGIIYYSGFKDKSRIWRCD